jgi:hypothetical protein
MSLRAGGTQLRGLVQSRGVLTGIAVTCLGLCLGWSLIDGDDFDHDRGRAIFGPKNFKYATIVYERHRQLKFDRLVILAHRQPASDDNVRQSLRFTSSVVAHRKPFTVLYDMREIHLPTLSRAQLGMGVAWARDHAFALDRQLQCIAFIFHSRLVRATAHLVLNFFQPPQPVHIGKDEASAFRFAREKCGGRARNWSADSKARDRKQGRKQWI